MNVRRVPPAAILLGGVWLALSCSSASAAGWKGAESAGWEERVAGRWNSLPEASVTAGDGDFRATIELSPGTGVLWRKKVEGEPPSGEPLAIEMTCSGTNSSSRDYDRYASHLPLAVTAVFGKDFVDIPWKKRIVAFFRGLWRGRSTSGIRLTFACGNTVPVGSMYRRGEGETVFIIASAEERGKEIRSVRNLANDFRAAYGREPRGSLTGILVSAERPSKETGPLKVELRLSSPLLKR
jgi:hypothetical protein